METRKIEVKISNEPVKVEYLNGWFILEPINALRFVEITANMGETPGAEYVRSLFESTIVEAQVGETHWSKEQGIEELFKIMPASVYVDLQNIILEVNNLLPEQRELLTRANEIETKK